MTKVLLISFTLLLFCGCAGPTSPFGAGSFVTEKMKSVFGAQNANNVKIVFYPKHQILHGRADFTAVIEDPNGITDDARIRLYYNKLDVTDKFLDQAKAVFLNPEHTKVQFSISNIHILPLKENKIYFGYMRNLKTKPIFSSYSPPECSAFNTQELASVHGFEITPNIKKMLQDMSNQDKINPNYLAGLVAQESSFDPKAVSWARAIGLTQITPLAEAEILKYYSDWPQYPKINGMPLASLKLLLMRNKINEKNEWRLNPALSLKGGLTYIKYLNSYWERPENVEKLRAIYKHPEMHTSSLILASYNSGPTRVNLALQKYGDGWLEKSPDLGEARLYVTRVTSYCDYFSQKEGQ